MKNYLVPFTEKEKVEAKNKEEAYDKIIKIIDENESPHQYYDADNNGIAEHLDSCNHFNIEPFDEDDIKIEDVRLSCELDYTAFDIARLGKDAIYNAAEESFLKVGLRIDIIEMDMIPIKIEEHFVTYNCIPTEHKIIFTDDNFVHWKDGIQMNPDMVKEESTTDLEITIKDLKITLSLTSKSCNYDSRTKIKLNNSFEAAKLDEILCNNKTDVVKYNGQNYICGISDDAYALWECEV